MRFLSLDRVPPSSRLAKPLYSDKGTVLLRQNVELTEPLILRLKGMGYTGVYVEDEISEGIEIVEVVDEKLRIDAANNLEKIITNNGNISELMPDISKIVDSVLYNKDVLINVNNLSRHHEYTFSHSVNVGILSVAVGMKLNLTNDQLNQLGAAGILHDVGKLKVPVDIIDKPGALSDEEFLIMKKHPEYGFRTLSNAHEVSALTKAGVYQHHERFDGTGYPRGLIGNDINLFGRILAITDTYDAMVTDRAYRKALSPFDSLEFIMGAGGRLFDLTIVEHFTKCITVYPLGSIVELSNGVTAIVIKNYNDCILRPLLRNVKNKELIDLKNDLKYLSTCIMKITTL